LVGKLTWQSVSFCTGNLPANTGDQKTAAKHKGHLPSRIVDGEHTRKEVLTWAMDGRKKQLGPRKAFS
jgi:hypothetical protein